MTRLSVIFRRLYRVYMTTERLNDIKKNNFHLTHNTHFFNFLLFSFQILQSFSGHPTEIFYEYIMHILKFH